MPTIEFVGQSSSDEDARFAQTGRLVNFYREPIAGQGQASWLLKGVPGMSATFADTGTLLVQAMLAVGDSLWVVANDGLYEIDAAGVVSSRGPVIVGEDCTIASNNGVVTVAGQGLFYTLASGSLTQPTAGAFSDFGSVSFLGGYSVLTERNGRRFQWSDLADATTLPGLNFASAEGRDGDLIRGMAINGNLWLFKGDSHEIWALTGQSGASAFARISGGVRDTGLLAYGLITRFDGGAFFVGDEGIAYVVNGLDLVPVSIPAVETAVQTETPRHCFYYEDEGHKFCVIRFRNRPAWVYDLATAEWHERAEGNDIGAWTAVAAEKFGSAWRVGTELGKINTLTRTQEDVTGELVRRAVGRTLYFDGARPTVAQMEVRGRFGFADIGRVPRLMLRVSRDNGSTWAEMEDRPIGALGEFSARAIWHRLGSGYQFTPEVTISDPADVPLLADARVEVA